MLYSCATGMLQALCGAIMVGGCVQVPLMIGAFPLTFGPLHPLRLQITIEDTCRVVFLNIGILVGCFPFRCAGILYSTVIVRILARVVISMLISPYVFNSEHWFWI